ncbi:MAG: molybdopterin-dependent oxidoreductase [Candidatus Poribacteria bacterium]|nr:molybdopterin-dependent oxidoreductase [Candidatus Poribacteria bacterium]
MAFIKLNDLEIEVEDGTNIVEAARENGIEVPHYCYHAGLSRPANCRMCLVEPYGPIPGAPPGTIGPARQLATGCTLTVRSAPPERKLEEKYDAIVRTDSSRVIKAREDILEFLLVHHPLDCPVCDQAGECDLQDFSYRHGHDKSRYIEVKNVPPKKDLGPDILLYSTRCIVCTRCIRFCDEVSGSGELGLINRGSHDEIDIPRSHEGTPIQLLDNKLAGNVVDICPVGALISKDFLFKSRPWFMEKADSICSGCSVGCNVTVEYKADGVYRIKPRFHEDINQHWMCDDGRLGYHYVNSDDRLQLPLKKVDGELVTTQWADALTLITENLSEVDAADIVVIGSAQGTNEDNYVLQQFAHDVLKTTQLGLFGQLPGEEHKFPQFTIEADKNPNTAGARTILGSANGNVVLEGDALWEKVASAKVVYIVSGVPERVLEDAERDALEKVDFLIVQDVLPSAVTELADVVLPGTTFAEKDGTFTNSTGWVQRIRKTIDPPGEAQVDWQITQQLAKQLGGEIDYHFAGEIAIAIAENVAGYGDATHQNIGDAGIKLD